MSESSQSSQPQPYFTVLSGSAILIGIVIGVGIFKAPSIVAGNVPDATWFIGLWVLGGLLAFVGALCYAELGAAHPNAGGEYHFLTRAYGAPVGLLFAWARCTVIQTGAIAAVAFVYGDYANVLIPLGTYGPGIHAFIAIVLLTALNVRGTVESARTQMVLTAMEVSVIVVVMIAGFIVASKGGAPVPVPSTSSGGSLGLAMVFVLLTYGGWNEVAYISAELKDVRRNMARMLILGMSVLIVLYVLVNLAYLGALGLGGLKQSNAVGADIMRLAFGNSGAYILSLAVVIAALSTINATIFTGARTYYALGRDIPLLHKLGIWSAAGDNPKNAFLVQGVIALALTLVGALSRDGFEAMVAYTAPVFWFFLALVGLSVILFRMREPNRDLPYRVPLYPLTPLILCATSLWMMYSSLMYAGPGAWLGVVILALGTPLIWLRQRGGATQETV